MTTYREKLLPGLWIYLISGLLVPASLIIFAPISEVAGVIVAIVLYGGTVAVLALGSPVIQLRDGRLSVGAAQIPVDFVGTTEGFTGAAATAERGLRLDARAWLCFRGWIDPVLKINLTDPDDPTPYWLVSTRKPADLAAAIAAAKSQVVS